uniref:Uncharacterized protein n=1 Tax=Siphoviridae sp. ctwQT14 TaxID=2827971 RepID=A0A8S5TKN4_9CAUD|nr:MAG TPA: hypothetical protein [Siphoviridae sp. ctwQT14]
MTWAYFYNQINLSRDVTANSNIHYFVVEKLFLYKILIINC